MNINMKEDKIKMKIASKGGKNSVPFKIKPSKTLECKKEQISSIGD